MRHFQFWHRPEQVVLLRQLAWRRQIASHPVLKVLCTTRDRARRPNLRCPWEVSACASSELRESRPALLERESPRLSIKCLELSAPQVRLRRSSFCGGRHWKEDRVKILKLLLIGNRKYLFDEILSPEIQFFGNAERNLSSKNEAKF